MDFKIEPHEAGCKGCYSPPAEDGKAFLKFDADRVIHCNCCEEGE